MKKIILVSDRPTPTGAPEATIRLGGIVPVVTDKRRAHLAISLRLGSISNPLAKEVENVVSYGVPLAQAVYMAAESPKKYLGIDDAYRVAVGRPATFNILNARGRVLQTYKNGVKTAK